MNTVEPTVFYQSRQSYNKIIKLRNTKCVSKSTEKVIDFDFLGDEYTSKLQLAKKLGVARQTVYTYHKYALEGISDFGADYPTFARNNCTNHPLTQYQVWVLTALIIRGKTSRLSTLLSIDKEDDYKYLKPSIINALSKEVYKRQFCDRLDNDAKSQQKTSEFFKE